MMPYLLSMMKLVGISMNKDSCAVTKADTLEIQKNLKILEDHIEILELLYEAPEGALSRIIKKGEYFTGINRTYERSLYQFDRFENGKAIVIWLAFDKMIADEKKKDELIWYLGNLDHDYRLATKEEIESYLTTGRFETEFPDKSSRNTQLVIVGKCTITMHDVDYEEYLAKHSKRKLENKNVFPNFTVV